MEGGGGNRVPLRDATNIYGKRSLPLVPGKFVIGRGVSAGFENRLEDPTKKVRNRSGELLVWDGGNSADDSNWKTWSLLESEKDAPKKSSSSSSISQPSGTKEDAFNSSTKNDDDVQIQKKRKFPNALNPGLHLIRGGDVASRDKVASSPNVEREAREESLVDVSGVRGYRVDGKGSCHLRLDSTDGDSGRNLTLLDLLDKSRVETVEEPSTSSGCKVSDPQGIGKGKGSCVAGDAGAHSNGSCSCPPCLRASWLLADFLCQDYRGRLTEVKKSRKAAGILIGRSFFRDSVGNGSEKSTKLEREVMQRWRSLFLHTEKKLLREGTELMRPGEDPEACNEGTVKGREGELWERRGERVGIITRVSRGLMQPLLSSTRINGDNSQLPAGLGITDSRVKNII